MLVEFVLIEFSLELRLELAWCLDISSSSEVVEELDESSCVDKWVLLVLECELQLEDSHWKEIVEDVEDDVDRHLDEVEDAEVVIWLVLDERFDEQFVVVHRLEEDVENTELVEQQERGDEGTRLELELFTGLDLVTSTLWSTSQKLNAPFA